MYYRIAAPRFGSRGSGCSGRLIMAAAIAIFSLISHFGTTQNNPITGETQHISINPKQEIALGLQAAPQMESEFGGEDTNPSDQAIVDQVGNKILQGSTAGNSPYQYEFHLLADPQTINAFALPGGQVFITRALYDKLQTEGELAGVLGHEIEADKFGVCFMNDSGYDPNEMISVMQILEASSSGNQPPEFFSTHPNPANRIQQIQADIQNSSACP